VAYRIGSAEDIPFSSETFQSCCAFGAFHWFYNEKAINEICRVLVARGSFVVVNKRDVGSFMEQVRAIVTQYAGRSYQPKKEGYRPAELLSHYGFTNIQMRDFESIEVLSLPDAVQLAQSTSAWSCVPPGAEADALADLAIQLRQTLRRGRYNRDIVTTVVTGVRG
jgi:SAM-dependent methyltransferase